MRVAVYSSLIVVISSDRTGGDARDQRRHSTVRRLASGCLTMEIMKSLLRVIIGAGCVRERERENPNNSRPN